MKKRSNFFALKFIFLISYFSFTSCSPEPKGIAKYGNTFKNILKSESEIVRGVEPGTFKETIVKNETATPEKPDSNVLYYEYDIDTSGYFSVEYFFDGNILQDYKVNVYLKDDEEYGQLLLDIKSFFTERFGEPVSEKGFFVWKTKNSKKQPVEISLTDDETNMQSEKEDEYAGVISISVYKDE
jgi:hypothetical protein